MKLSNNRIYFVSAKTITKKRQKSCLESQRTCTISVMLCMWQNKQEADYWKRLTKSRIRKTIRLVCSWQQVKDGPLEH